MTGLFRGEGRGRKGKRGEEGGGRGEEGGGRGREGGGKEVE